MRMMIAIERIINKIIRWYKKKIFSEKLKLKHDNYTLVGNVNIINKNVKIGEGVVIYPDVTFWGDGPIIIGNNVSIG